MKKIIIAFLIGFTLTSCSKSDEFTENDCVNSDFYYYENEKIILDDLNYNHLVIGFVEEIDDLTIIEYVNNLNGFNEVISDDIQYSYDNHRFIIAKFNRETSCIEINSEIANVITQNKVQYANKAYNTDFFNHQGEYDLMYTTDQFSIKLKQSTSMSQLNDLISEMEGVSILEENEYIENTFLMRNTNKNRNTIETCNLFFETGLFEFSEPNFFYFKF